nr:hypothetical protein [Mycoplasmopsis cynos]
MEVEIKPTFSYPYFSTKYSNISSRRLSWISISISGNPLRSSFKNLSNKRSNSNGLIDVIFNKYEINDPAAEPRPGPIKIPFLWAKLITSWIIKK